MTSTVRMSKDWWQLPHQGRKKILPNPKTPFEDDAYYTPAQVADMLHRSKETVKRWGIPAQPLPKGKVYLGRDINDFLANQRVK